MPTDCSKPTVQFTPLSRREVLAEFDAGAISSDGGVILLREVDRRINLLDRVDELIPDPRDPLHIEHDQRTMLAQRVLAIACGWEDLNDHATLRNDLVLQLATNRKASGDQGDVDPDRPLASASTLCRLENRIDRKTCVQINQLLVELFIESHKTPPKEVVLDFDATDDPVHGKHIRGYLTAGFIFSSVARKTPQVMAIGYADSADGTGVNAAQNSIELKYTALGDTNLDGVVNLSDLLSLVRHFGNGTSWDTGDLNYDGSVNGRFHGVDAKLR